jgi:serine/threonine-protein kinase
MEPLYEAGVPPSVSNLIARCTAKNPVERPQGFGAVTADLDRAIAELDAPTVMLPATPRATPAVTVAEPPVAAPRPAWLVPGILALIVVIGAGLYFARNKTVPIPKLPEAPLTKGIVMKGGEMVLVEAGSFLSGEKKQSDMLPAFYIDKTEVSNAAYAQFCQETGHALPTGFEADRRDYPVVNVLVLDARAFAQWAGKRLPTGREWEKAARGTDGRLYPWGNEADTARANVGSGKLLPVSDLPNGASPCGALNLSGNVWELVDQVSPPGEGAFAEFSKVFKELNLAPPTRDEPWYMVRGQSFSAAERLDPTGLWDNSTVPERGAAHNIGFRCVKDAR